METISFHPSIGYRFTQKARGDNVYVWGKK